MKQHLDFIIEETRQDGEPRWSRINNHLMALEKDAGMHRIAVSHIAPKLAVADMSRRTSIIDQLVMGELKMAVAKLEAAAA